MSAASGLFKRLPERALATLRPPAAPADKLVLEAFEPRVLLSGDPAIPRIDGSLDVAGQSDRYAFALTQDLRVVFDCLTGSNNLRWSLDGPRGNGYSFSVTLIAHSAAQPMTDAKGIGACRAGVRTVPA